MPRTTPRSRIWRCPRRVIRSTFRASYELRGVLPPIKLLADAASGLGHNRFVLDPDGPLRHLIPFVRTHHRVVPSLGVSAALRVAGIKPQDVRLDGTTFGSAIA
jgi:CHASE2 domain.